MDYYIQHSGTLPPEKEIRRYGHKIPDLYQACCSVAHNRKIGFHFQYEMDERIRQSIIDLLGSFAETSGRYSNINMLLGQENKSNDCIEQWFHTVDLPLYDKHISAVAKLGTSFRKPRKDAPRPERFAKNKRDSRSGGFFDAKRAA